MTGLSARITKLYKRIRGGEEIVDLNRLLACDDGKSGKPESLPHLFLSLLNSV